MDDSLAGHLLIATPALNDPNFFRTVVLLLQHDGEGAMGVVINRPLSKTIGEAWKQISAKPYKNPSPLFDGGPCPSPLIVLHVRENQADGQALPGLYFTMSSVAVTALVENEATPIKFFVGNAGWSPGQLEKEIDQGAWLIAPATPELVFRSDESQWLDLTRAVARARTVPDLNPKIIPPDPSVN